MKHKSDDCGTLVLSKGPDLERLNTSVNCRICGKNNSLDSIGRSINGYPLFSCSYCQTAIVVRRPDVQEVAAVYDSLFREGEYEQHRAEYETIKGGKRVHSFYRSYLLKRIERSCSKGNMVEIGGGTGAFGVFVKSRGWQYVDYDISNVAVDYARKLGLRAHVFAVGKLPPLPRRSTDAAVMWEVIEHIWDVHSYLTTILESLKPNGTLMLSTPNFDFQSEFEKTRPALCMPPVHINFFTEHSLKSTLEFAGFRNIQIIKRRLYRPILEIKSIIMSLGWGFGLYPPKTLYAIAKI